VADAGIREGAEGELEDVVELGDGATTVGRGDLGRDDVTASAGGSGCRVRVWEEEKGDGRTGDALFTHADVWEHDYKVTRN
jgi:hypothetical protein